MVRKKQGCVYLEEGQHSWYRASPLVQFVSTILFSPSSLRHFALLAIALFNYVHPLFACNYQNELSLHPDYNKALYGHSFRNFSRMTLENCLAQCLKHCLCLSFQICNNNNDPQCQLCSSNKYLNPSSLKQCEGCTNYNFGRQDDKEVRVKMKIEFHVEEVKGCLSLTQIALKRSNTGWCVQHVYHYISKS